MPLLIMDGCARRSLAGSKGPIAQGPELRGSRKTSATRAESIEWLEADAGRWIKHADTHAEPGLDRQLVEPALA